MKIDTAHIHPAAPGKPPGARPGAGGSPAAAPLKRAFDVHISSGAAKQAVADQQEDEALRRARVAAIRDQLAAGSYNISGKDVASKILEALKS